jgi:single-strand DNA-binding protein
VSEREHEQARNEVALVGRVSGEPEERTLPSGDVLVIWRVVVDRPPSRRKLPEGARPVTNDTFDCVAWAAGVRRTAAAFVSGDVVQVDGSLRRRFWRAGAGATSKCEIEVASTKRLARAQASR